MRIELAAAALRNGFFIKSWPKYHPGRLVWLIQVCDECMAIIWEDICENMHHCVYLENRAPCARDSPKPCPVMDSTQKIGPDTVEVTFSNTLKGGLIQFL